MKSPLRKRLPRELKGEIGKYLVVLILMIATIGFVSGFLVADGSMIKAYNEVFEKYKIDTPVIKFFIGIKSILCISAHSANTIKYNYISALSFFIKLIPFRSINLCSCKCFFNNYRFRVNFFYISNLPFNTLLLLAYSTVTIHTHCFYLLY